MTETPRLGDTLYYLQYVCTGNFATACYIGRPALYAATYAGPPVEMWLRFDSRSAVWVRESKLGSQVFTDETEAQQAAYRWTKRLRESWRSL